jgi:hypothetical protein
MMTAPAAAHAATAPVLTEAALERHFRAMLPDARVLSLDDLTGHKFTGCVDGRRAQCVAGVPGSSAGLLVLLLTTLEARTGERLSSSAVRELFSRYVDRFRAFHLHTDRAAQLRLGAALEQEPDGLVRTPPEHLRAPLLDALMQPAHVGCGHLRLLLEEPAAYGVRRELVEAVLASFYLRLWEGDGRLDLDILDGDHHEGGVARIRSRPGDPLVTACPRHGELELFVYHPDAVAWLHARHAVFLASQGYIAPDQIPACAASQRRLGEQHLEATLQRLAPELPVFDVWIGPGTDSTPGRITVQRNT